MNAVQPEPARLTTVLLRDGRTVTGLLRRFDPTTSDFAVQVDPQRREMLTAESISLFAWHRGSVPRPATAGSLMRLHLLQGAPWMITKRRDHADTPVGFYAVPADPSPYDEVFVYNHAVRSVEQADPEVPPSERRPRMRLGEILVEAGLATPEMIEVGLAEQQRRTGKRLGEVLVELGLVTDVDIAQVLARKFALPFVDLVKQPPDDDAAKEVPRATIERFGLLPIAAGTRQITVAIADPSSVDMLDSLRFQLNKRVTAVVVPAAQLRAAIDDYLRRQEKRKQQDDMEHLLTALGEGSAQNASEPPVAVAESDSAVIKLVNQMIADAHRRGASDIHVEPNGRSRRVVIRFRIDGDCVIYQEIPSTYRAAVVARIKILANLDISERRKPQDGKIQLRMGKRVLELRVATIPTVGDNEDVVMRMLAASRARPLEEMDLSERNLSEMQRLVQRPYGLLLCVGPTGSGKTTTLHAALGVINHPDRKIWTAEDPVEITQPGLRQVQVQPKIGFTFANAMRAFLRADPDVIMVGEMRDKETAETGVEASLTGHLVLSTLHTNSAPETITRLVDLGLEPFSFADALLGVLAQRLVRRLCPQCSEPHEASAEQRTELRAALGEELPETVILRRPVGCEACGNSGYAGRLGVHELLVTDEAVRRAVQTSAPVDELRRLARLGGMTTLLQDGARKVLAGVTDLEQLRATCGW